MKNIFILLCLVCAGCATTTDRFKLVSTQASTGTPVGNEIVRGESCRKSILFVIPFEREGTLEGAVENALQKVPSANSLVDLKVKRENLMTVFYNYHCITVGACPSIS